MITMEKSSMTERRSVTEIIGKEEADSLRDEVWEAIGDGCSYDEVEEIMAGYGLEMDYIDELI